MQLLTLRMQFFGPYRDETVDFRAFAETPLFLISGKTGSGKTTIFDAMVYALYGATSGSDRSGDEMRANFATPEEPTRVTLTFTHGGKAYRVWREPAQARAKKRGGGLMNAPAKQSLTETVDGVETHEWTKAGAISAQIDRLLHLDADQFRQMVLLPQGKFRQFLDANSKAKSDLLRHLFATDLYDRWQTALATNAKTHLATVQKQADRLTTLAGQFDYGELAAPDATAAMTDQLAAMEEALTAQAETVAGLRKDAKLAAAAFEAANTAFQAGATLSQAYADKATAEAALAKLAAQAAERDEKQRQLALLKWAQRQTAAAAQLADTEATVGSLAAASTAASAQAATASAALTAATSAQAALDAQQAAMTTAQQRLDTLATLRPQLEQLAALRAQAASAQTADKKAQTALKAAATAAAETAAALDAATSRQAALSAGDQQERAHAAETRLAELRPLREQWAKARTEAFATRTAHEAAETAVADTTQAASAASAHYNELHDAQLNQQIATLAAQLSPDAPCPVCGSLDHPHPAGGAGTALVTDAEVSEADAKRQKAQARQAKAEARRSETAARLTKQQADVKALAVTIDPANSDPDAIFAAAMEAAATLAAAVADTKAQLAALATEVTALTAAQKKAAAELDTATKQAQAAATAQAAAAAAVATAEGAVPPDAPALTELAAQQAKLTATLTAYDAERQAVAKQLTDAQAAQTRWITEAASLAQQLTAAKQKQETQAAAFDAALIAELGRADHAQFAALQAQQDTIPALEAALAAAKTQHDQQTALLARATATIGDQARPDQAALKAAREEAGAAQMSAQQALVTHEDQLARGRKLVRTIAHDFAQNKTALAEATALGDLAAVVNGKNGGALSLERYVLRAYLSRVLEVASPRLQQLTNGRYQFQLHAELVKHRTNSSLEIDVYDDQVGQVRSVHTLSGGESFIAALSLALALGEVIQQESGGVAIDALFVDEGFGSLDTASLDVAMQALESIEGQSRMIGIISHVTELKDSVPDQLQVVPTGTGESHIRVKQAARL